MRQMPPATHLLFLLKMFAKMFAKLIIGQVSKIFHIQGKRYSFLNILKYTQNKFMHKTHFSCHFKKR